MIRITTILPVEKAGIVQERCSEFECQLINIAVTSNSSARVTLSGPEDKMHELFELIDEELPSED